MTPLRWTEADLVHLPAHVREQIGRTAPSGETKSDPRETPVKEPARKYHNQPTVIDGIRFDSKLEGRCYLWLKERQYAAGDVAWFIRQVPFHLEGGVIYRADFLVVLTALGALRRAEMGVDSGVEVWDAKGRDTQASRNKRKQVCARYGVQVQLWPPR